MTAMAALEAGWVSIYLFPASLVEAGIVEGRGWDWGRPASFRVLAISDIVAEILMMSRSWPSDNWGGGAPDSGGTSAEAR